VSMPCAGRRWRFGLLAIGVAASVPGDAHAQLIQEYFPTDIPGYSAGFSPSVIDRMNLQEQAEGIEHGDFIFRPNLSENLGYDSSALGTPDSGSSLMETNASLRANSDWTRNSLGASFDVDNHHYFALPFADYTNWKAGIGSSVTLGNDTLTLAYSHLGLNLAATDLGVSGVEAPVPYTVNDARLSYSKLFSRFAVIPSFEFETFSFGQAGEPLPVNFDSLNHHVYSGGVTTRYEFSPGDAAEATIRVSEADFSIAPSSNYSDIQGFVGLDFGGDGIIRYRTLFGIEHRKFSSSATPTLNTPTFELDVEWTPTQLDTVTATGARELDNPTSPFASGVTATQGRLEYDHELRSNLFLRGFADAGQSQSQPSIVGLASNNQTEYGFGASAIWDVSRNVRGTLSYGYQRRLTDTPDTTPTAGSGNFTSNTFLIGVSLFE
jgi:hypothetical protein